VWGFVMASADEYREFARDCLRWAQKNRDPEQHRALMKMAEVWTEAALQLEQAPVPRGIAKAPLPQPKSKAS
jgi:ferric-dicitrate binding protein FerR (iron transport regulator)